ncbi:MAG: ABC transporter permease [Dehalococcoidia bacterium]
MSSTTMALRQVKYENRSFWRNPAAAFFTFLLPLIFLVLFNAIFGDSVLEIDGRVMDGSTFYVPGIAALSVVSACYTNIGMMVTIARDLGTLKRVRGTPLPPWAYIFGRLAHSVLVSVLMVAIVTGAGALAYGTHVPDNTLPSFLLTIVVGSLAFCALGLALTAVIPNADAAPAITNGTILPLLFISNVFIPMEDPPAWLDFVGDVFPVKHFAAALQTSYDPAQGGAGFEWVDLAIIAAWGVIGTVLAVRFFSWEPRQ